MGYAAVGRGALTLLAALVAIGCAADAWGEVERAQVAPGPGWTGGSVVVYEWAREVNAQGDYGRVVVVGPGAALPPEGTQAGLEHWFATRQGSADPDASSFRLELVLSGAPDEPAIQAAVAELWADATYLGGMEVLPAWTPAAPVPTDAPVFTLASVGCVAHPEAAPIGAISVAMAVDSSGPLLPTFYASDGSITSIFGDSVAPEQGASVGASVELAAVAPGQPGHPDPTWLQYP
ncbi:MAG: hypothetical protein ACFCGT_05510 [Sandaracinaceae bacterium]